MTYEIGSWKDTYKCLVDVHTDVVLMGKAWEAVESLLILFLFMTQLENIIQPTVEKGLESAQSHVNERWRTPIAIII